MSLAHCLQLKNKESSGSYNTRLTTTCEDFKVQSATSLLGTNNSEWQNKWE